MSHFLENMLEFYRHGKRHNFKVGDVVECIADCYGFDNEKVASVGDRRTVTAITVVSFMYRRDETIDPRYSEVVDCNAPDRWKLADEEKL